MDRHTFPEVASLSEHECWEQLRSVATGRLAVIHDDGPDLFPLNYVVDHGTLVFRTGDGTKLAALAKEPRVAFEVDGFGAATGQAWSVVVKGRAESISGLYEGLEALTLPLAPWQDGAKHHFVRIVPVEVTGRRFAVVDPAVWHNPLADVHPQAPE